MSEYESEENLAKYKKFNELKKRYLNTNRAIQAWAAGDKYGMFSADLSALDTPESKRRIAEIKKKYGDRSVADASVEELEKDRQALRDFMEG